MAATSPGRSRLEALPTDAIRSLPDDDECLADRLRIDPPSRRRGFSNDGTVSRQESNGMLAMTVGDRNELIQYFSFLTL